jgi:hypothetical protein
MADDGLCQAGGRHVGACLRNSNPAQDSHSAPEDDAIAENIAARHIKSGYCW